MDKPYILPANSGDQYYDFDIDPHFKEDRYLQAVQTRTTMGYSVVHHFSTSLVEDPQVDPDGMFLSEYSIGKGADISSNQPSPVAPHCRDIWSSLPHAWQSTMY